MPAVLAAQNVLFIIKPLSLSAPTLQDEDSTALISPGGVVARKLLTIINEPRLHEGLAEGLPSALCGDDVPPHVFAYLTGPEAAVLGVQLSEAGAAPSEAGSSNMARMSSQ